jgi:hypothetical protein
MPRPAACTTCSRLTRAQALALEPELHCVAALHSPSSGIVDSHGLMTALLGDAQNAGAMFAVASPFESATQGGGRWQVRTGGAESFELATRWLVNAAGLDAQAVAAGMAGFPAACHSATPPGQGPLFRAGPQGAVPPPDLPHAGGRRPGRAPDAGPGRPGALRARREVAARGGRPASRWTMPPTRSGRRPSKPRCAATGRACRQGALQPSYTGIRPKISGPGRTGGRLPHRRPGRTWRGRRGAAVRHRVARPDVVPGDRRTGVGDGRLIAAANAPRPATMRAACAGRLLARRLLQSPPCPIP